MDVMEKARHRRRWFSRWIPFRSGALVVLGCSLAALLAGSASAVDPTFTQAPGSPIATGSGAIAIAAADLNGDGRSDLAVANQGAGNVSILLGNGSGGFNNAAGSPVAVGTDPVAVVAANLNGAGGLDLAVANENATGVGSVSILLGNGTGGFSNAAGSPVTTGPTGSAPQSIAVADLNGAGGLDLAVVNEGTNDVSILLGNGTGGFSNAAGSPVTGLTGPEGSAVADYNADGKLDLAVANTGTTNLSVLVGNGLGGFSASGSPLPAGGAPTTIVAANLNGDTKPDLAVANYDTGNVTVQLNTTAGPTAVALRSFAAQATRRGVELRWRMAQETAILGFDVYRAGVKLNRTLIPAHGAGARGASYRLLDRSARLGAAATYRLRAVRADGSHAWIGRAVARR